MNDKIYNIHFHPQVDSDSNNAYDWYELQQHGLGNRFLNKLNEKLKVIIKSPEIFGVKSRKGYHEAKIDDFPYVIVYTIYPRKNRIFIITIHHEKMNPAKKYRK